jgi:hypothetical protein
MEKLLAGFLWELINPKPTGKYMEIIITGKSLSLKIIINC